jgi:hypothetical protein
MDAAVETGSSFTFRGATGLRFEGGSAFFAVLRSAIASP